MPNFSVLQLTTIFKVWLNRLANGLAPMMIFGGERFGAADTSRIVGIFSSSAQIGAALAKSIFGVLLVRYDSFALIWSVCAALALVRDRKADQPTMAVQTS